MQKKLYYCEYWPKKNIASYSYCLSDLIYQNSNYKTIAQIHGIILNNNTILTFTQNQLKDFEIEVRSAIRKFYKNSIVKIWYYREDDQEFNTENIPSRFAITIQDSIEIINTQNLLLNEVEKCVIKLIKDFNK
jgi:hypothetical protein